MRSGWRGQTGGAGAVIGAASLGGDDLLDHDGLDRLVAAAGLDAGDGVDDGLALLVGDLACKVNADEPTEMEIGFTLALAEQGRGYATEALNALLDHGFGPLHLHRVIAITDARNTAAAALLNRVGMRQ